MRILHLNTYDRLGGAARAAYRIHARLRQSGVHSRMMVQDAPGDDWSVIGCGRGIRDQLDAWIAQKMNRLPLRLYRRRHPTQWSTNWFRTGLTRRVMEFHPDIVHLHWVGDGFVPIRDLARFNVPIVWSLHDLWPMTGGCHLPGTCLRYTAACGCCPRLGSANEWDITRYTVSHKRRSWERTDITVVATSRWMATCTASSELFRRRRIEVIPLGLDLDAFKPLDKAWARRTLNLPPDKHVILMGALSLSSDPNKGFHQMIEVAKLLSGRGWTDKVELVFFGASEPHVAPVMGLSATYLGRLHDDAALAVLYSAADVMVCPSKEESFGQTVLEAMACGTPCVAFGVGGLMELVEHGITGYVARPQDSGDLAHGIEWVLADKDRWNGMARASRSRAEKNFSAAQAARRYTELYQTLWEGDRA